MAVDARILIVARDDVRAGPLAEGLDRLGWRTITARGPYAALAALGRTAQVPWHIDFARQNGMTDDEIAEAFTHLAFYAGWPAAVSALACLAEEKR